MTSYAPMRRVRSVRRVRRVRILLVSVAALIALILGFVSSSERGAGQAATVTSGPPLPAASVQLTVPSVRGGIRVPRSFLGVSTEYWTLPIYEHHLKLFERVLSLLRVRGDGPMVLRIGGDSADHVRWTSRARRLPPWTFRVTPAFLARIRTLVGQADMRVILDLNLDTASPRDVSRLARAARVMLPHRSIAALEVGNEPDVVDRSFRLASIMQGIKAPANLVMPESVRRYVHNFRRYSHALSLAAPGVPLAGPALASSTRHLNWIEALLIRRFPRLGMITAHSYRFSACSSPRSWSYPTIARLLDNAGMASWAGRTGVIAALAHLDALKFRMTELNSVACGGVPGISNSFATALWAPDALFRLLQARVDGVNVHLRAYPINAPFTIVRGKLEARPFLYGLLLFARMLGPGARVVPVQVSGQPDAQLAAYAVRLRGRALRVLILDKSPRPLNVHLRLPSSAGAVVQRLLAPYIRATGGVTLAGQRLGRDGQWLGHRQVSPVAHTGHDYELTVPAMSAALVSMAGHGR